METLVKVFTIRNISNVVTVCLSKHNEQIYYVLPEYNITKKKY